MVYISFGTIRGNVITKDQFTSNGLSVDLELSQSRNLHTLLIYHYINGHLIIDMLIINIKGNDVSSGSTIKMFQLHSGIVETDYHVNVYKQRDVISSGQILHQAETLLTFEKKYGLDFLSTTTFTVIGNELKRPEQNPSTPMKPGWEDRITEGEKKFCSCVLKVNAKGGVKSPYAVCASTVGTTVGRSRKCDANYDFSAMPDDLLRSYLDLKKVTLPGEYNRDAALNAIKNKLSS